MSQLNFLIGLGIFLWGMSQLERGIHRLSALRLRQWLRHSTGTSIGSVGTGILTTALLQSSSMVSLLVLAFASAGLLPLLNAVGIILGANLGTTFTGWIVAIFGFKVDLESLALPLVGAAAFVTAFRETEGRLHHLAQVALGIGLLLFGLSLMKASMETIPERWDVSLLQGHHAVLYLLFGVLITFLVQSSSAVMMMSLAALNSGFVTLPEAAAVVIGADLGTTSTTVLASLGGSTIKRQLAFAHLVFNLVVDLAAFVLLLPALPWLLQLLRIDDALLGLVAFHSAMNVLGLLAFLPFIRQFVHWIEKVFLRFGPESKGLLERVPPRVVDAALVAMRDTVRSMVLQAACNGLRLFALEPRRYGDIRTVIERAAGPVDGLDYEKGYRYLKRQEGELLGYALRIQEQPLNPAAAAAIENLLGMTRSVIYSNKTLKDIQQDLQELRHADLPAMVELYDLQRQYQQTVFEKLIDLVLTGNDAQFVLEELDELHNGNQRHYEDANKSVQARAAMYTGDTALLSMQLNVNREIRVAVENMVKSIRALVMDQASVGVPPLESEPAS